MRVVDDFDDFDDTRELYAMALASAGFDVAEAANGEEALLRVAATRPAVVVMDLSMPVVDDQSRTARP